MGSRRLEEDVCQRLTDMAVRAEGQASILLNTSAMIESVSASLLKLQDEKFGFQTERSVRQTTARAVLDGVRCWEPAKPILPIASMLHVHQPSSVRDSSAPWT